MDTSKIIGLEGGKDGCYFKILMEEGRGETEYYPSIKDGVELRWHHPEYQRYKTIRKRQTIRMTVSGNPIAAEDLISKMLGCRAFAVGPHSLDIYPDEKEDQP